MIKSHILDAGLTHESVRMYGNSSIGTNCKIFENVILSYPSNFIIDKSLKLKKNIFKYQYNGSSIGNNAIIRSGSIFYNDVNVGNDLITGHNILIRENTIIGNHVLIGTNVVIEGNTTIGNHVSIQSNAYIPTNTIIEDKVFIGPGVVLTNDKYPIRKYFELTGPILRKGSSIGANSTILPGIEIGEGAMVAAGAVVTKNVPLWKLAIGSPAKIMDMPDDLMNLNSV
ncbi:MAG: N-acetyltransferase [ANME-2 cluster archaeon]|nr:MAG: N-acetyltransferase [ANME-2 cluster archaeon]